MSAFRRVGSRSVHSWAAWDLRSVTVAAPDGEIFERTFVDSPGAVAVVALHPDESVVLVRQYRAAYDSTMVELPAGMRDVPGEDPLVTARRELAEEAGLAAETWLRLGVCSSAPGITNSDVEIYMARDLTEVPLEPHGPEEISMTCESVPLSAALAMVRRGEITDSKTMIGLLLAVDALHGLGDPT